MARPVLPTDFKDDVLAESMAGKRRYRIIQNVDGTVSLDDVTDYEQVGSTFGAKQVNDMSSAVNSIEDVKAANNCTTTEPGFVLDARQGKNLMDKSNELGRDLQNKMSKYYGSVTLSEANEKAVLKYLLLDVDLMSKYGNCNFSVIVNSAQFYSGTMYSDGGVTAWGQIQQRNSDNAPGSLYSFYYNRGADPVLKKLGNDSPNTITVNILKGNGRKSLEGMSSVVLTKQENGRYAVTSAPKSFGIRDGNGTVDWDYNMGGASITQE